MRILFIDLCSQDFRRVALRLPLWRLDKSKIGYRLTATVAALGSHLLGTVRKVVS